MKNHIFLLIALSFFTNTLLAQTTAKTSIASSLDLFVFPSNDQDQATQDTDEMACYKWAKEQTGYDPMNPTQYVGAKVDTSLDGTAVAGSAVGAAGGAAIGAIAGDTGKGAAIGAVLGAVRGRRAKVMSEHEHQEKNNEAAAAKTKADHDNYKKAFTACMDGKGYTVK